jgi:uncharacterized protein (DUF1501 family)
MLIRSRRDFLKTAFGAAAGMGALGKFGEMAAMAANPTNLASQPYQALVCIYLAGGNDCHNTVFPINTAKNTYNLYKQGRQTLALPSVGVPTINDGSDVYGLHPKLAQIGQLYNAGAAAVVANVGSLVQPLTKQQYQSNNLAILPQQLFSHSDQTSQWQSAIPNGSASTGWGGRMEDLMVPANANAKFSSITSTSGCGLFCNGAQTYASTVPVGGASLLVGASGNRLAAVQQLMTFDNGLKLVTAANAVYSRGVGFSNALNAAIGTAKVNTIFPNTLIGQQLLTVAKIISIRAALGITRQVFFCQLGGFDFHTNELTDQDNLLGQLSPALNQFYLATQELLVDKSVTSFTASEFGRTLQPNGSGGTDHAWGGHHFVVGGSVLGGKIYGQYPSLALGGPDDANTRGTLIPTTAVSQYAATMATWFGVDPLSLSGVGGVCPGVGAFPTSNLGFLG